MSQFDYTVRTTKDFDQAVAEIERLIPEKGFKVQHIHDVQQTLASKGFERGPLKIIETCNAKYADQVLRKNALISLMMPCKINVWREDNQTVISTLRPIVLKDFFPEDELESFALEVDRILCAIIDEVK